MNQKQNKNNIEDIENNEKYEESSSEDSLLEKPKKTYVLTDARKKAFEKARQVRAERIASRKELRDKKENEYQQL